MVFFGGLIFGPQPGAAARGGGSLSANRHAPSRGSIDGMKKICREFAPSPAGGGAADTQSGELRGGANPSGFALSGESSSFGHSGRTASTG